MILDKTKPYYAHRQDVGETTSTIKEIPQAKPFKNEWGLDLFIYKNELNGIYYIVDSITGRSIGRGDTRKQCITETESLMDYRSAINCGNYTNKIINQFIESGDTTPRYISGTLDESTSLMTPSQRVDYLDSIITNDPHKEKWGNLHNEVVEKAKEVKLRLT